VPSPEQSAADHIAPHALAAQPRLEARFRNRPLLVFLDYDGTLCPIVSRPEDAQLAPSMREALAHLAARHRVGVVSGRSLADLRARVGLSDLWYAGNHGFEWTMPPSPTVHREAGEAHLAALAAVAAQLGTALAGIRGVILEDKRYSLSIHYRLVAAGEVDTVIGAVHAAAAGRPELRVRGGKCVVEVLPSIDWHKGRAVRRLVEAAALPGAVPIFIGDDVTDEDAFRELSGDGVGVLVSAEPRPTDAGYRLRDVGEVERFLRWLASLAGGIRA